MPVPAQSGHSVQSSGFPRQAIRPPQGMPLGAGRKHITVLSSEPVYTRPQRMHPASGRGFL
jgi:hypothetical protein